MSECETALFVAYTYQYHGLHDIVQKAHHSDNLMSRAFSCFCTSSRAAHIPTT